MNPYRKAACKKLAIGVGLIIFALVWLFTRGSSVVKNANSIGMKLFGLVALGLLAASLKPFFERFLGLLFGMPVKDFTDKMDAKPLWQRFLIAVFLLVFLLAFVFGVFLIGLGKILTWIIGDS